MSVMVELFVNNVILIQKHMEHNQNKQNKKNRLLFNEKNHHYTLDGKPVTGNTTILNKVLAKPALIPWAANESAKEMGWLDPKYNKKEKCIKQAELFLNKIKKMSAGDYFKLLEQARKAHCQKRDTAGDIGKFVHEQIENWIKGQPVKKMNKQAQKMFDNFINWATENKVKFLASEQRVYSEKYWYAGTFDFLCKLDGKTYLGDIKTGSGIYPEMWAQCAGYQIALQENEPKTKIDGHLIVNLKKDGTIKTQTNYDYIGYKKMFLSALVIYRQLFN